MIGASFIYRDYCSWGGWRAKRISDANELVCKRKFSFIAFLICEMLAHDFGFQQVGGCMTLWKQNKTVQSKKKLVIWLASDSKKVVWLFLHVTAMSKSSVTIAWKIKGGKKKEEKNSHQALAVYYRKPFHTSIFSSGYMHSIIHLAGHVLNSFTYQNG